jgi:hypothetical protein
MQSETGRGNIQAFLRLRTTSFLLVGLLAFVPLSACEKSEDIGAVGPQNTAPEDPKIKYPKEWKSSLTEAEKKTKFKLKFPHHELASQDNLKDVYVFPEASGVAFQFSLKKEPQSPIDQQVIEIFITPYQGTDPVADYEASIQEDPEGKKLHTVNGEVALSDEPHDDQIGTDVAFLRFVWNGLEIQLSGGESVDDLIQIAESLKDV